jgi:phage gp37-like protein
MNGLIATLHDAVAAKIKARLPTLRTCERHEGRFTVEDLGRVTTPPPAVYVAFLGCPKGESGAGRNGEMEAAFATFIITSGKDRERAAQNIAEVIADLGMKSHWDVSWVEAADQVEVQNLYTPGLAAKGVALYGVGWRNRIIVGKSIWDGDETAWDPTGIYVGELLGPDSDVLLDTRDTAVLQPEG